MEFVHPDLVSKNKQNEWTKEQNTLNFDFKRTALTKPYYFVKHGDEKKKNWSFLANVYFTSIESTLLDTFTCVHSGFFFYTNVQNNIINDIHKFKQKNEGKNLTMHIDTGIPISVWPSVKTDDVL